MSTITRTVQSTATKEVSTATLNGWNLTFTVETSDDNTNVTVNGRNGGSYLNGYANQEPSSNISFSQGTYDAVVANAVVAEMESIVNSVEE